MIELVVAARWASLPRLAKVIDRFSRLGRLSWLADGSSLPSPSIPDVPVVNNLAELQPDSRLVLLLAPPDAAVAGLERCQDVLRVSERCVGLALDVARDHLLVDEFAQLKLLAGLPDYPGICRLLQSLGWNTSEHRDAVLGRFAPALHALRATGKAVVFGAQRLGEEVCRSLQAAGTSVPAFVDNNVRKHGASINGIPVQPLSALTDKALPVVIATTRFTSSITRQLEAEGFQHILPYSVMSLVDGIGYPDEIPYIGIQQDFSDNAIKYLGLFLALADDKSRRVLDGLIAYRLNYDSRLADAVSDEYARQYFDVDLVKYDGKDVFVDLGGYDGDTAEKFIQYSRGSYAKIYLFEPDENLLRRAADRLHGYKAIELIPAGAYSSDGELRFAASGRTNGAISEVGELVIPVRKLDSVVTEAPTLIKMDIEGAEIEALRGAASVLRTARPKLAIAAYHYAPDLWRLVEVVRDINPNYQFYLRHYSETGLESVIYAV